MPKVTLTFQLPEEREDYEITSKAINMHIAIHDFSQVLREYRKYRELDESQSKLIEELSEKWRECIEDV